MHSYKVTINENIQGVYLYINRILCITCWTAAFFPVFLSFFFYLLDFCIDFSIFIDERM